MKKVLLVLLAVVLLGGAAQAQVFKLSLWGDICVPNEDYTGGLELAIGTETPAVDGVQLAFIYAQADKMRGLQSAIVSSTKDGQGVQWSFVNLADQFQGAQFGFVNWSKDVKGLQWGFINYTETMKGLQIGLVNIIKNNPTFLPVFVFVNFSF
jgi:hypothetical protein